MIDAHTVVAANPGVESLKISVIILNWNGCALTVNCIDSVIQNEAAIPYEIIVVDNGSSESDWELLRSKIPPSVRLISLNENLYFGEANNIGAEAAHGEYILLLNNDVVLTRGTFAKLLRVFDDEFFPGAAGPRLLYPDGRVQEAGAFILPSGWPLRQGNGGVLIDNRFEQGNHVVDYCSAACLLLRKDVFLSIGGFDPLFDPAYFEDVDLALRLRSIGLYTYFCADADAYHHENSTSSKVWSSPELNNVVAANHHKFLGRWQRYLDTRQTSEVSLPAFEPLVEKPEERDDLEIRKRILLCSSTSMRMSAECEELLQIAETLARKYDVTFASPEACSRARIYSLCRSLGLRLPNFRIIKFSTAAFGDYDHVVFGDGWTNLPGKPAHALLASEVSSDFLDALASGQCRNNGPLD